MRARSLRKSDLSNPSEHEPEASRHPGPAGLVFLRGCDADGRLRELAELRRGARPVLGTLAARLVNESLYENLGYRSLGDFAREQLGVGAKAVREWARVHEALAELPALREAVGRGEVSFAVARVVVSVATPETDAACLESVRGRTLRSVQAMVREVKAALEVAEADRVPVRLRCSPDEALLWYAAVELARRTAGEELPLWRCAEAMAAEVASRVGGAAFLRTDEPGPAADRDEPALREVAFPQVRWRSRATKVPRLLAPYLERVEDGSAREIAQRMRAVTLALQDSDFEMGRILKQMSDRRLFSEIGFPGMARYVEERLDLSARSARRLVALARGEARAPAVANAFREGELNGFQAGAVLGAERPDAWIQRAQEVSYRQLLNELDARMPTVIAFRAPPEVASLFLGMIDQTGGLAPFLAHVITEWMVQGAQFHDYADFERDGFRCTVPGCTARRNLHSHHIRFRSAGGPDEPENRTTLCAMHHERALHRDRTLRIRGRAPHALLFELGFDRGERFRSGDLRLQVNRKVRSNPLPLNSP